MSPLGGYGSVGEFKKFFEGRKYGCNRVLRMVCHLLDNVLALKDFMWHQLTVVFLEMSENVSHGVSDGVCCAVLDTRKILLLDCGKYLLQEVLLDSCHFAKENHFLRVCVYHV